MFKNILVSQCLFSTCTKTSVRSLRTGFRVKEPQINFGSRSLGETQIRGLKQH